MTLPGPDKLSANESELIDLDLLSLASVQGAAWARAGVDVRKQIRAHSAHWPSDQRKGLVRAALEGAGRVLS